MVQGKKKRQVRDQCKRNKEKIKENSMTTAKLRVALWLGSKMSKCRMHKTCSEVVYQQSRPEMENMSGSRNLVKFRKQTSQWYKMNNFDLASKTIDLYSMNDAGIVADWYQMYQQHAVFLKGFENQTKKVDILIINEYMHIAISEIQY